MYHVRYTSSTVNIRSLVLHDVYHPCYTVEVTSPLAGHKPDCACPVCTAARRNDSSVLLAVRMPLSLREWVRARPEGGSEFVRRLLEEARAAEADGIG